MRTIGFIVLAWMAALAPLAFSQTAAPPLALGYHVDTTPREVTGVRLVDADTFDVGAERIRVNNLDAPESFRPDCDSERALAARANAEAGRIFAGARQIILYPERRRDRSARVLARVEVDGQDFATLLIRQGLARPWVGRSSDWCGVN